MKKRGQQPLLPPVFEAALAAFVIEMALCRNRLNSVSITRSNESSNQKASFEIADDDPQLSTSYDPLLP